QRAFVDAADDLLLVLTDDDVELRLSLVQVTNRGEVRSLVDHAIATRVDGSKAREHDRLGDGDVLMHDRRPGRRADDAPDLVADAHGRLPPPLPPGADPALGPLSGELAEASCGFPRHRAERVVDEVGRLREDRELAPILEELTH